MKQHGLFLALSALVVSLAGREAAAEPPGVLHLSGRIADGGEPVQGPASLTVTFWSDAVSSEPAAVLWTDVIQVQADGGLFHALVGAAPENPLPGDLFSGGDVFIGLAVDDAEELSPRLPVASVPYALEAGDAATLQGQGPNAFAAADHTHPPAFSAGEGVVLDGGVLALDEMMVLQWAQEACYDSPDEVLTELDGWFAPADHAHGDLYYSKAEVDAALALKQDKGDPVAAPIPAGAVLFSVSHDDPSLAAAGFQRLDGSLVTDAYWKSISTADSPGVRVEHTCTWTGAGMACWGGRNTWTTTYNTGAIYLPATNSWKPMSNSSAPAVRAGHSAVLTPDGIIYWGGWYNDGSVKYRNSGAIYYLASDTWNGGTATGAAPAARANHTAVWTGTRMIVWGGVGSGAYRNDGAAFDPVTNSWGPIFQVLTPRSEHTAIWTGDRMIVWGGGNGSSVFADGAAYDPVADAWLSLPPAPASFAGRRSHSAVWTGEEMILFGGNSSPTSSTPLLSAAAYRPADGTWRTIPVSDLSVPRYRHVAVFTGDHMIIWGGVTGTDVTSSGDVYYLATDSWNPMPLQSAPAGRYGAQAAWTGTEMVVFGGADQPGNALTTGGRYRPGLTLYPYQKQ